MNKTLRNSNIELLRILCMLFVIGGHVIMKYGTYDIGITEYYIGNILRSFFIVAVNCFVIISGFFSIQLNIKKLIKMGIQVSFYTVIIYIITLTLGIHKFNIKNDILVVFSLFTKRYWYITIYFVLCIISPLLNIIVENLSKDQFKTMILTSIILFYCFPTICYLINSPTITSDSGYGLINFICLYFIGRYIKIYYNDQKSKLYYATGYILSSLSLFLANNILTKLLGFYFNSFISYDTIFLFISAFMLFMLFKNINLNSKIINNLAKYALVAFIIHMHPTFFDYLFYNIFKIKNYSGISYLTIIFIIPIVVYCVSWVIEWIRVKLFDNIENTFINKILNNKKYQKDKIGLA